MAKIDKLLAHAEAHLQAGETMTASVMGAREVVMMGTSSTRSGVLIATDRRVVFYAKKMWGFDLESFPFEKISSFEHGKSAMGHYVTFYASGNHVSVKWLTPAKDFEAFLEVVKTAMTSHASSASGRGTEDASHSRSDIMQQLRELAELRDAGIVTTDEFERKKVELLRRI